MAKLMTSKLKKLIRAIKKIDPKAAEYIKKTVFPRYYANGNQPPNDLESLFIWAESPQGNGYWLEIYKKVVQNERD